MVLAAVDDLLFSSKIRTVARHVGVEVAFARTPEAAIEQARRDRPTLAIVDLNCAKVDPVRTIAAIRGDSDLGATRIVGFASHVQTALIEAARAAGADAVMARSAFALQLADILGQAR